MLVGGDAGTELNAQGFAIVRDVIPQQAVDEAIRAIERVDGEVGRRRRGATYAMRDVLNEAPAARTCAEQDGVVRIVHEVLGADAFTRGILFDKNPRANWAVPWHQDTTIAVRARPAGEAPGFGPWSVKAGVPHVQPPASVLEAMLTVRIHLDDCGDDNARLRVIPGSHRHGIREGESLERVRTSHVPVVCVVPAGGVLLMRPLLLHASSPARVPGHRRVIHVEWAAGEPPHGLERNRV